MAGGSVCAVDTRVGVRSLVNKEAPMTLRCLGRPVIAQHLEAGIVEEIKFIFTGGEMLRRRLDSG